MICGPAFTGKGRSRNGAQPDRRRARGMNRGRRGTDEARRSAAQDRAGDAHGRLRYAQGRCSRGPCTRAPGTLGRGVDRTRRKPRSGGPGSRARQAQEGSRGTLACGCCDSDLRPAVGELRHRSQAIPLPPNDAGLRALRAALHLRRRQGDGARLARGTPWLALPVRSAGTGSGRRVRGAQRMVNGVSIDGRGLVRKRARLPAGARSRAGRKPPREVRLRGTPIRVSSPICFSARLLARSAFGATVSADSSRR